MGIESSTDFEVLTEFYEYSVADDLRDRFVVESSGEERQLVIRPTIEGIGGRAVPYTSDKGDREAYLRIRQETDPDDGEYRYALFVCVGPSELEAILDDRFAINLGMDDLGYRLRAAVVNESLRTILAAMPALLGDANLHG